MGSCHVERKDRVWEDEKSAEVLASFSVKGSMYDS